MPEVCRSEQDLTPAMRILVYPHELAMGGSQINALELAGAVRDLGHNVTVFATSGVLVEKVRMLNLEYVEAPRRRFAVDPATIRKLTTTVRSRGIDVVHPYEWAPSIDTAFGPGLRLGTPAVMTVLSMDVPDFLPRHFPLIVGTHALAVQQNLRRSHVQVMEPPVDTAQNKPSVVPNARRQLHIPPDQLVVSVVGRLTTDLEKLQGVEAAIRVMDNLSESRPVTLLIAGDGEGLADVAAAARAVNRRRGREVVRVLGNVGDPRPLYDAADVVLGMGSSALRGMAYAKPLIVQGTRGFWKLASPETAPRFLQDGWFGHGGGGGADLTQILALLLDNEQLRSELGAFGRELVEQRFGLDQAARKLEATYRRLLLAPPGARLNSSVVRTGYGVAKFRAVMNFRQPKPPLSPRKSPA
ncbi:glycosyltransferase family 4 protein [Arthrobacter sp. AL08]|uniref:glycosyltransferase family 4 protein n=1 Tax=unclassified Arthrobacter TaxID=235627 RepID=UPI00249B6844|nr:MULTISPECIES: glycosyltransferase family 4 protein [unclassified Arthrobacter]MDI3242025.1 glycosyltransferase family 4 protein [Arthrobacter sp. AL05]MDI3278035.1 glycosyltransferase family 4 protein [Arthrobacter sp. AL08]